MEINAGTSRRRDAALELCGNYELLESFRGFSFAWRNFRILGVSSSFRIPRGSGCSRFDGFLSTSMCRAAPRIRSVPVIRERKAAPFRFNIFAVSRMHRVIIIRASETSKRSLCFRDTGFIR